MKYRPVTKIIVSLALGQATVRVGTLATIKRAIYFEYEPSFIDSGIELSPFRLPLKAGTFQAKPEPFDGLFGVFNDSLPDGWGRLLLDRSLKGHGVSPEDLSPLDRLTHVGSNGMGALLFEPDASEKVTKGKFLDLAKLAEETSKVIAGETEEVFEELLELSGSSAGARPKVMVGVSPNKEQIVHGQQELPINFEHWLIKFGSRGDPSDIGAIEFAYSLMARRAGLDVMPTHLFMAKKGRGYFGVQRFDRQSGHRIHMHSLAGLIHSDHRMPSLDYEDILRATLTLTRNMQEVEKMFRLAAFNVLAKNRDDHAKNFAFLMDAKGGWRASPAYDLTYSRGPGGEQSTMVMGEGKTPGRPHLLQLAEKFGILKTKAAAILDQVAEAVGNWKLIADEAGVSKASAKTIASGIQQIA
jgi:serine/threonine-protein kinase HipA